MRFRLLGPLEVFDGDRPVAVGGGKRRSLLVVLLLHANEVLSAERLIDELWGERPTATASKSLHVYVSQLRRELGGSGGQANGGVLLTRGNGYVIEIGVDELDILHFERVLAEGQRALAAGQPDVSSERLRQALAMWRGPPLADCSYEPFAQRDIARLEEQRMVALEARVEADLALGRHAEIIGEVESLVAEHPLRERLRRQLMLALYRCGRQADALDSFRAGRTRMVEELGLEPGPQLRELEAQILSQSPDLAAPRGPPRTSPGAASEASGPLARDRPFVRGRGGRVAALAGVGASVLLGAAVLAAVAERGDDAPDSKRVALDLAPNSIAAVSRTDGGARLALPLPGRPTGLVAAGDTAWAVTVNSSALVTVDTGTRSITRSVPLDMKPGAVAFGEGAVWVADGRRGVVVRAEPGYDDVSAAIPFRRGAPPSRAGPDATSIAAGAGGVWVTDGSERLARVDARTRALVVIPTGHSLDGVAVGAGAVWAISARRASVLRIDSRSNRVSDRIPIVSRPGEEAPFPAAIAVTDGAVWVLNRNTATVARIDPRTRGIAVVVPIGVDRVPNDIAAAGRTAWVANEDGTLSRIEEGASEARSRWVGESLRDVAADGARLWVGTAALDQQLPGGAG